MVFLHKNPQKVNIHTIVKRFDKLQNSLLIDKNEFYVIILKAPHLK